MRKITKLLLIVFAFSFSASMIAQETVPFTSVDSQASSGVASVNATLTGGYTLGTIDWDGFASTINGATYGSELTCDISGPLGSATVTLGNGTTYSPGANFTGSTNTFNGAGDPAGTWTFDFYETYDDGGDGLPDATWDNISFDFNAAAAFPVLNPATFCQVVSGSFAAGGNVTYELNLLAAETYNFSLCSDDLCCGGAADNFDGDFTLFDASFAQVWYIDGASSCGYDASTFGSAYEDWSPTADGTYYLQVDDWAGGAGDFDLAYIMGGAVQLGTPTATCQNTVGSFGPGESVYHEFYLLTTETYNFSTCNLDGCAGDADGDTDFRLYDNTGTMLWYIDGNSSCGWDGTTYGSSHENYTPPAEGCYYLEVDEYGTGTNTINYTLAYVMSGAAGTAWTGAVDTDWNNTGNWTSGVPAAGDDVALATGLPNYPVIDGTYACNGLTIDAGASFTVGTGGDFTVGADLNANGAFVMNDGACAITGDLNNNDAANALVDINGGSLTIGGGWYQAGYFSFARGSFQLSGGTIDVAADVAWYDVNGTSLMDGPFYMTIGGTLQTEAALFASITDGTVEMTGADGGGGYLLSPSSSSAFTVNNLVVSGGDYLTSRDAENNDFDVLNDFSVTGGSVVTENATGNSATFTVGGNCFVGVGANLTANVLTAFNVTGDMDLASTTAGYASLLDNGLITVSGFQTIGAAMTNGWHTMSVPVAGLQSGYFTGLYLQNFDETNNIWNDIIPTNIPLTPGTGFAYYDALGGGVYNGVYNTGTITNNTLTRNNQGWNMVGNPYPSPIDWDAASGWTKTNVADATYVEDAGAWATWIAGVGTGNGSNLVAPGQGFFVECTNVAGGTLEFTDAVRTHARTPFLKSEVTDLLKVQVTGNGYTDDMAIRFLDDATDGFDFNYDAHKMFAYNVEIPQIYSMANGYMAINALPATNMVPAGFRTAIPGEFTISATETSEFNNVVLEDLFTGEQTDLLSDSYTFAGTVDDNEARFIIHFTPLAVGDNLAEASNIYSYHKNIYVTVPENTKGYITVYDMMGKEVANAAINSTLNTITLEKSAYYVVKVLSNESIVTEKVFIK